MQHLGSDNPNTSSKNLRADVFFDGQNLFHTIRNRFDYTHPNFDVKALAEALVKRRGWELGRVHFYTGVPTVEESPHWHHFWNKKLAHMGRQGVDVFSAPLRYGPPVQRPGDTHARRIGVEKGIDVRIALDMVRCAYEKSCEAMILVSQDNDLGEALREVRNIARSQGRKVEVGTAYAQPEGMRVRGIDGAEWMPFDKAFYDLCIDRRDYRMQSSGDENRTEAGLLRNAQRAMAEVCRHDSPRHAPC